MSRHEERLSTPTVTFPTLVHRLRRIGVSPLDDAWVQHAMKAAALELPPSAWRVRLAHRQWTRHEGQWKVFACEDYVRETREKLADKEAAMEYGMPMPPEIAARVGLVRALMPSARIEIFALKTDDPYVKVIDGSESAWIGGWYGRGPLQQIFLGP